MTSIGIAAIEQLAERIAINDLIFTVARAMDTKDWITLAACYLPDAVGDYQSGEVIGRGEIINAADRFLTPFDATQHLVSNVQVLIDGKTATSHATFIAQHVRDGAAGNGRFLMGGNYDDTLVHTEAGWRISRRRIRGIWGDGDASVLSAGFVEAEAPINFKATVS